jgi:hypothetical protein
MMIRALPLPFAALGFLNYLITKLPDYQIPFDSQLLCFRFGCRRVLRTEAGGLAAVNPACAEAAAVHGRTACRPANTGDSVRSQLPGGNGSRQQNGRHNGCKQCRLADLSHHGSRFLS